MTTTDLQQAARDYLERGFAPVPLPPNSKKPVLKDWTSLRITAETIPLHFKAPSNLGVLNGEPSRDLLDVDLDTKEAVFVAPYFLPPTALKFGHASKRASHWYYRSSPVPATKKFRDPMKRGNDDKNMLVELRSTGTQTVFPPSIHPSGEAITFDSNGEPAVVDPQVLLAAVTRVAAAALLARYWPSTGTRHDAALALSGMLLRAGWELSATTTFLEAVARAAGDEEWQARLGDARSTDETLRAGKPVTGVPTLAEMLDPKVVRKLCEWLKLTAAAASPPTSDGPDHTVVLAPASSFHPEPVRSAWEGRVPLGMVTLIVGVPGKGKSTLTVELVARASRGQLPGDLFGQSVTVALATAEDAISQVVVPRLIAAGADLDRVRIIQVRHEGTVGGLALPDDIDKLREQLIAAEARIVVVDPLVAHIVGSINTWKDQDVRRVLAPLAHLAEEADAAVVGVMHLNKNQTSDVLNKVGGSVGFGAAARSVLFFAPDPEDPDPESYKRILAHAKCNVGPLAPALRFRVQGREIESKDHTIIKTSGIAWDGEARGVSAADLVVEPATAEERQAKTAKEQDIEEAMEVIRELLAGGTTEADAVQKELTRLKIKERTWREAKRRLGIQSKKSSFKAGWEWVLPEGGQRSPYNPEPSAFDKQRENNTAKYPNNAEDDEGDEDGRRSEDGRLVCTPSKASKTTKADEGDEDGRDTRAVPLRSGATTTASSTRLPTPDQGKVAA